MVEGRRWFLIGVMLIGLTLLSACGKKDSDVSDSPHESSKQIVTEENESVIVDQEEIEASNQDPGDTAKASNEFGTMSEAPVWNFQHGNNFIEWDSDMPFINPMGSREAYLDVLFASNSGMDLTYVDEKNIWRTRTVFGDTYKMTVAFDQALTYEENTQFLVDISSYVDQIGGHILGYGDEFVGFTADDPEGNHWWCGLGVGNEVLEITVTREEELRLGETIHISPEDYEDNQYCFTSYNDGETFQSFTAIVDKNYYNVDIVHENAYGAYKRYIDYSVSVEREYGQVFTYDDAMTDEGVYYWIISWYEDDMPEGMVISLEDCGKTDYVEHGEALGGIKVSTEVAESISVTPTGNRFMYLEHPEVSDGRFEMDMTPDGDYLMYVPSGLWDVGIVPKGDGNLADYMTKLVPVNSGEITEVTIPLQYERLLSDEGNDNRTSGLAMEKPVAAGNNASFNFTLVDSELSEVIPDEGNTTITEGGREVEILSIDRINTPPSVVILLDSSGSMKGQMEGVLEAAATFIESLPEETWVKIIDFDTEPKVLSGTSIDEALSGLNKISVGGATALYDSILEGYELLEDRSRPTLVVFTDGTDANYNDTAAGSAATLEEVLALADASRISVYTIGFGKNHDQKTLATIAEHSAGLYYSAEDDYALEEVFYAIDHKLNNSFEVTYERPKEATPSDMLMVSFVIDVSGSMFDNMDGCGWRMDDVKTVFHDFIMDLPSDTQMQLMTFNDEIHINQSSTTDKTRILRALGELEAGGGTNILNSVEYGQTTLDMMPSTKKIMIYLTDIALEVDESDQSYFDELLMGFDDKDLNVLWIGMGMDDEEEAKIGEVAFSYAAELSGGSYVLSEDHETIRKAFDAVLLKTREEASEDYLASIQIDVEKVSDDGTRKAYSATQVAKMPELPRAEEVVMAETVNYTTGLTLKQYDQESASLISGGGVPGEDTKITKRMPLESTGSNEAIEIKAEEIFYLANLDGVNPPSGYRFIAVNLNLKHILPLQEMVVYPEGTGHPASWVGGGTAASGEVKKVKVPYLIPDFKNHFFMTYNSEGSYPASTATWLTNEPLAVPGNQSITIMPDDSEQGMLVFLVPDEATTQCSLHFYDTGYGHIDIPLVGVMKRYDMSVETLPTSVTTDLTESFSLRMDGYTDTYEIMTESDAGDGAVYRIIEGSFDSKVQALLELNPMERFQLRFPTESGDFYLPLSPLTANIPLGMAQPRMLAPGSFNSARWVFEIPEGLIDNRSKLMVELQGADASATVSEGDRIEADQVATYHHDWFDLIINDFYETEGIMDNYGRWLVVDVTIQDFKDGYSTQGIENILYLKPDQNGSTSNQGDSDSSDEDESYSETVTLGSFGVNLSGTKEKGSIYPDPLTEELLLGMNSSAIIYDGTSRRGQIVFFLREEDDPQAYTLVSNVVDDLSLKVSDGEHRSDLFALKGYLDMDESYSESLSEAINKRVSAYQALHPEMDESIEGTLTEEAAKPSIPAPALTIYGSQQLSSITSEEHLWKKLKELKLIANPDLIIGRYTFAPEALLTQGGGNAMDMAKLAHEALCRLGYKPSLREVELTDQGRSWLEQKSGYDEIRTLSVPAVAYDRNGETVYMVMPFVEPLSELDGLAYMKEFTPVELESDQAYISVSVRGEYVGGSAAAVTVDVIDAFAGDDDGVTYYEEELLGQTLTTEELSLDAIDVLMIQSGRELNAMVVTAGGEYIGDNPIAALDFKVHSIIVSVQIPGEENWIHEVAISDRVPIEKVYMALSLGAPTPTTAAAKALETKNIQVKQLVEEADALSALRWYSRSMLNDFLYQQGLLEAELSEAYTITANHAETEKGVALTLCLDGMKLLTSVDLLETQMDFYSGTDEEKRSIRTIHGLNMSILEGSILKDGYGLVEIWAQMPDDTQIMVFDSDTVDQGGSEYLKKLGVRDSMIEYFMTQNRLFMMPSQASIIDGETYWAWYEYYSGDGSLISVLDTGEHGAITSETILQDMVGLAQYAVGAFKGVETSVWAVAGYSLEEDDYAVILKKAKALAMAIAENLAGVSDPKAWLQDQAKGYAQKQLTDATGIDSASFGGVTGGIPGMDTIPNKDDYKGYQNGFKAGVEYYFNIAK